MRTRLLVVFGVLVGLLVVGLGAPLAGAAASAATSRLFADRLGDTTRFAALAQRAVTDDEPGALAGELARYDELYGVAAVVLDREGRVLTASRPEVSDATVARVQLALVGQRSEPPDTVWPWDTAPMLLAEPVLVGGEVRGAAVTVSPTAPARWETLRAWAALAGAALVALAVAAGLALPLVRWILAPVESLDAGTAQVAAAVRAGRAPRPVGDDHGPPELRRLSRHFDQMAVGVTHALESQRAFVADAGHQLRNPLTALRLRLQNVGAALAAPDVRVDPDALAALRDEHGAALEETDRLAAVLDALLALARAEGRPPQPVPMPIDPVLDERADTWSVLAEHESLSLRRLGPGGLVARSDVDSVVAVLDAVLDNALKYAPPGTDVELSTARVDGWVEIGVRDHGDGIDPGELARATDRFWRSPAQDGSTGTGLGLAIAARSAERVGGELLLQLPEDGGLRVVLRLPPAAAPAADDERADAAAGSADAPVSDAPVSDAPVSDAPVPGIPVSGVAASGAAASRPAVDQSPLTAR
ncbi:sensor histidine kinase [Actinomycetospora chibensis]|uniref:histidine kinase n=1 Tax=Actinomycetospora chibensis TaxID=663606 RepID=A0ABV9RS77_9PSEU|nr:HAMP domain-containing sensor histidine kinase [Actinomycetospora chibensis]MDD7924478.1 HAMP domain-containing sensor histidine kinase [Actinomycetospora chibensis]